MKNNWELNIEAANNFLDSMEDAPPTPALIALMAPIREREEFKRQTIARMKECISSGNPIQYEDAQLLIDLAEGITRI